ncbi:hypothetical protein JRO89_XS14G0170300 [Xanthoceras sorbifolium]|uniref:NAD(P)H dehydrogenase (quinone) n=1 Tax=Xanthoceras sorbifolium TaxID=99658 RepID=A0ABQ8H5K0_9ROSI|nr:hypothetical protein JRO89_XS14G0170300 [Xanthoceras sorbifolium]
MDSIEASPSAPTSKPAIKVAALCGSLRKASTNLGLIRAGRRGDSHDASSVCDDAPRPPPFGKDGSMEVRKESMTMEEMEIEYIDISTLPMLNTDLLENGVFPPAVEAFRNKILEADCFLFASPEYNYSVTAPLKNALDWASLPPKNVWADKAAAIMSSSGILGGARGQYHFRQIGVFLDLHIINNPEFFLNAFELPEKFDSNGNLIDPKAKEKLKKVLLALQAFTLPIKRVDKAANEGEQEFISEVNSISRTNCKNLVRLLGFYNAGQNRLLVYEYMSRLPVWALKAELGKQDSDCFWNRKRAVLLARRMQHFVISSLRPARISVFGLAKLLKAEQTQTTIATRGTKGYVAPEWFKNLPITVKVDVATALEYCCLNSYAVERTLRWMRRKMK